MFLKELIGLWAVSENDMSALNEGWRILEILHPNATILFVGLKNHSLEKRSKEVVSLVLARDNPLDILNHR